MVNIFFCTPLRSFAVNPFPIGIALLCLFVAMQSPAQDTINPSIVTNTIYNCETPAEVEFKDIKFNGRKNTDITVTAGQELTLSTELNYIKRAQGSETLQFGKNPNYPDFATPPDSTIKKRFKPDVLVTYELYPSWSSPISGTGTTASINAPTGTGTETLDVIFNGSGDEDCVVPINQDQTFNLTVSDGPCMTITATEGWEEPGDEVESGSYLSKNQGQELKLTADFSTANLPFNDNQIIWSVTPGDAGIFTEGTSGKSVAWKQQDGFISDAENDVVITATAPGLAPAQFTLTVIAIASASDELQTDSAKDCDSSYTPNVSSKTKLETLLADCNKAPFTVREWAFVHNIASKEGELQILTSPKVNANVIQKVSFYVDPSSPANAPKLKVHVESGSMPDNVWITHENNSGTKATSIEHMNVLPTGVKCEVGWVRQPWDLLGHTTACLPWHRSGTSILLLAISKNVSSIFPAGFPFWKVTPIHPTTATVVQPPDGINPVTIRFNAPGQYRVTATGTDNSSAEFIVNVIKVDIVEVASDQIAGNKCNKLPTAFYKGEPNNPMLMATRRGRDAHLAVKATVLPNDVTTAYIGVRKVGEPSLLASSQIVPLITPTHLEFDAYDDSGAMAEATLMYEVVGGIDANNNNALDSSEVSAVFEKTPKTDAQGNPATNGLDRVDKIFVVTKSQFLSSKDIVIAYNVPFTDYAGDLIEAFGEGATTVPEAFVTINLPISTATPGLSHHVGAKWNTDCVDMTYRFTFQDGTEAANDFEESTALSEIIDSVIQANIVALLAADTADWTESPGMSFAEPKNFIVTDDELLGFNELGLSFGKVTIKGTLWIKYRKTNPNTIEVQQIKAKGSFDDLYDFSFWGGDEARQASMVQAGHATLSTLAKPSGKVFFTRLEYSTDWKDRRGTCRSP